MNFRSARKKIRSSLPVSSSQETLYGALLLPPRRRPVLQHPHLQCRRSCPAPSSKLSARRADRSRPSAYATTDRQRGVPSLPAAAAAPFSATAPSSARYPGTVRAEANRGVRVWGRISFCASLVRRYMTMGRARWRPQPAASRTSTLRPTAKASPMASELDTRRRRAYWRACHRGTKEIDLLFGRYAEALPANPCRRRFGQLRAAIGAARP